NLISTVVEDRVSRRAMGGCCLTMAYPALWSGSLVILADLDMVLRCSGESRGLRLGAASLTTLRDLRQHSVVTDLSLLGALGGSALLVLGWRPWSSLSTRCSGESRGLRSGAASLTTLRDLRQHFVVTDLGFLGALGDSTLLLLIWGPWSSLSTSLCSSPTWD